MYALNEWSQVYCDKSGLNVNSVSESAIPIAFKFRNMSKIFGGQGSQSSLEKLKV